jgi:hypothetical protein
VFTYSAFWKTTAEINKITISKSTFTINLGVV